MKICCHCHLEKPFLLFHKNSRRKDGFAAECKQCIKDRHQEPEVILRRKAAHKKRLETFEARQDQHYRIAKARSKKEGWYFNLEVSDIIIPAQCPYLNIPLTYTIGEGIVFSNSSLDRIDSTKGYVKGNIQVISHLANQIKSNATLEQLLTFAKNALCLHGG